MEATAVKIRHPLLLQAAGFAIAGVVRTWVGTLRYRRKVLDPAVDPLIPRQKRRFIYSFYHETLLLPALRYAHTPTKVLISDHADGEMIAQACRHLGLGVVRGSATRGGVKAIRQILKLGGKNHIVVTPDGPRGPRRHVKPEVISLAARTQLPIVPVGFAYHKAWRLNTWDRFWVPCPFSPAVGVLGAAITVPEGLSRADLWHCRQKVQDAMDQLMAQAEELAKKERW